MEVKMVHRGFFVVRIVAALLLIGLLALGGVALYRAGLAQGYAQGVLVAAASGEQTAPAAPVQPGMMLPYAGFYPGWYFGFPPFGGILGFFLFGFLLLLVLGALFRPRHWGYAPTGGPYGMHHHGFPPPWAKGSQPGEPGAGEQPESGAPKGEGK
jgi:hypothetical protein